MKNILAILGIWAATALGAAAIAEDKPGAVVADEVETVVTVRAVHHQNRTVTVEGENGRLVTIKVPDESQNLYQVYPGAKFKVRYVQAVAVGVLEPGSEPSRQAAEAMELAPKGATPGGVMVRVVQVSGKIEEINYADRKILVRGSQGNLREFVVSDAVERFEELKVGDVVALRVTEGLAMEMIPE
jgi:hypothetical protein